MHTYYLCSVYRLKIRKIKLNTPGVEVWTPFQPVLCNTSFDRNNRFQMFCCSKLRIFLFLLWESFPTPNILRSPLHVPHE